MGSVAKRDNAYGDGTMEPVIAVISASDAFASLWPELASSAGGTARIGESDEEVAPLEAVAGVIVAAGGVEPEAVEPMQRLLELTRAPVVVVGATADHRVAVTLMRAGASDYFALPED